MIAALGHCLQKRGVSQRLCLLAMLSMMSGCSDDGQTSLSAYAGGERDFGVGVLGLGDGAPRAPEAADGGDLPPARVDSGPSVGVDGGPMRPEELPEGDEACAEFALCMRDCAGDPPCATACREGTPPASVARYDAFINCAFGAGCNEPGGRFNAACVEARCFIEQVTCFGPPPPPPPEGMGVLRCPDFVYCLENCPPMDDECADDCYRSARPEVAGQYASIQRCWDTCPASDYACRANACRAQAMICYGPQPPGPMGMSSCTELDTCVEGCNPNNEICIERCYAVASPEGYNEYFGLDACVEESDCAAGDRECAQRVCEASWIACFGRGPMGNGDCRTLYACAEGCGNDRDCVEACVVAASVEAHADWTVAEGCMRRAGCRMGDAQCIRNHCAAEMEACVGPPNPAMGNASCREFDLCLTGCNSNRFCIAQCIEMASPAAYDAHRAIRACWAATGCGAGAPGCCIAEERACDAT